MKILISAYACEPNKGSEPGVGWNWAKEISKKNDVIVITRENNRKDIESALEKEHNLRLEFIYFDLPPYLMSWKKGIRGVHLYYVLWQYGAYKVAKEIVAKEKIDVVLGVTFGNLWKPTFMHKLPTSFIWGPVGGGEQIPTQLWSYLSFNQLISELTRKFSKYIPLSNPFFSSICRNSKVIIVRTQDTLNCIPKKYRHKCRIMIETGVNDKELDLFKAVSNNPSDSQDIIYMGRLISLKFVDIGIKAFSKIAHKYPNTKFHIVGDGPCRKKLEELAEKLGISDQIIFHGMVKRDKALKLLLQTRMMVMTSAKEGGAWVLFESMMCGKPIICMDTAGMKLIVSSDTGIKIKVENYNQLVDEFSSSIDMLLTDSKRVDELGNQSLIKVSKEFSWETKATFFENILDEFIR